MHPVVHQDDEPQRADRRRPRLVWLLTAFLGLVATALALPGFLASPASAIPPLAGILLLPLFALAEVVVIHLPTLRNSHAHSLREVPAVVGLSLLDPQAYVVVYVIGAVAALVFWVRMRGVKLAFNTSLFAFEAALGAVTYHAVLGTGEATEPIGWLAALAAVLLTDLISAAAVTAAISATEGSYDDGVLREALRWGVPAACLNTCVALLFATLVVLKPVALVLLGVILVLLVLGYRVYIGLARGHTRTKMLYGFVDRTSSAQVIDDVVRITLREAAELMSAETTQLIELSPEDPTTLLRSHSLIDGQVVTTDARPPPGTAPWWRAAAQGAPVLLAHKPQRGESADKRPVSAREPDWGLACWQPRDGVASPLRAGGRILAVLLACNRSFEEETFGPEDLQVFEALSTHAAVALERASTVDRLRRLAEERAYDALHDPLSGLPNRRAFNEALTRLLEDPATAARGGGVLLVLDLDDFKDVNDTLGHSAGDRLISVSGDRLRAHAAGLVARLGGDEFAVLLPGHTVEQGLAHATVLREALSQPVPLDDVNLAVSASIGLASFTSFPASADELMSQADVAMYTAKADRSGVAAYRAEIGDSTARRLALAADLPEALESGQIQFWYQPQAEASTGIVTGFEALVRWDHQAFGMVPPPEIIAVAHRTGWSRRLTDSLLRQALDAGQRWRAAGHDLAVSVNVTPVDVADPALVGRVEDELARSQTPAEALILEITESDAMKDPERCLDILAALSDLGVTVSIDDFGTGYSSLAYLDRLPVKEVKIDQSFVFRLERGAADSTIVSATVTLAHDLGMRVVAEGVESALARRVVRDLGVDLVQGYGLARPMPEPEVLPWLERHAELRAAARAAPPGSLPDVSSGEAPLWGVGA